MADAVRLALVAVLPAKDLEEVLQGDLWALPTAQGGETRGADRPASPTAEAAAKQVLLAAETGASSKFDATDQVQGHVATGQESKYDRAPEKLFFYPRTYHPQQDALQTVHGLRSWHDPRGRLWPSDSINRLERNCSMMVEKHAHGEPRSVVVPLFTYSTFMFKPLVWALWTPVDASGGGRWHILPERDDLEQGYQRFWREFTSPKCRRTSVSSSGSVGRTRARSRSRVSTSDASEEPTGLRLGSAADTVRSVVAGALGVANRAESGSEGMGEATVTVPEVLEPIMVHGCFPMSTAEGGGAVFRRPEEVEKKNWAGLAMWQGPRVEWLLSLGDTIGGVAERMSTCIMSEGSSSGSESDRDRSSDTDSASRDCASECAFLIRYSTPSEFLGSPLNPLNDCTIWLPPPSVMFAGAVPMQPARFRSMRVSGYVAQKAKVQQRPHLSAGADMDFLPPPGLLEYIHSRRSDEPLSQHKEVSPEGGDRKLLYKVIKADTQSGDLIDRCHSERNQQQYKPELHKLLRSSLLAAQKSGERHPVGGEMLKQLVELKTGVDPLSDSSRPTPLSIAHSLDLQELQWEDRSWVVGFSGEPFLLATRRLGVVPLYRCQYSFEDQPYWHLNQSARNCQFGKGCGSLHVKPRGELHRERKLGKIEREYWDDLAGTYQAPRPEYIGVGLGLLSAVATLDNDTEKATRVDALRQRAWRMTMRKDPDSSGRLRNIRVVWKSQKEEEWRSSSEADFWEELRAPYENSNRSSPGGVWKVLANAAPDEDDGKKRRGPGKQPDVRFLEVVLQPSDSWLDMGTWMLIQVRPLLFHIEHAMSSMRPVVGQWRCAPERTLKLYRGLANVNLDARIYARGKVILWGQYSSSSKDQGVAQSFAGGGGRASVFTLEGFSCRLIAPWSRFGREEEWLFPLNTLWQLTQLLTEAQQQILGKSGLQLYEMTEVNCDTMYLIQVRSVLQKASTAAAASIIFQSEAALQSGGILNLALRTVDEGHTPPTWSYTVQVVYDGSGKCPVQTSTQWTDCEFDDAQALFDKMVTAQRTGSDTPQANTPAVSPSRLRASSTTSSQGRRNSLAPTLRPTKAMSVEALPAPKPTDVEPREQEDGALLFTPQTSDGMLVLQRIAKVLKISRPEMASLKAESSDTIEIHVQDNTARWEVDVALRRRAGRIGNAVKDEGAELLASIIVRGVPLRYIDLRNNGIQEVGACKLLAAIRHNDNILSCIVANAGTPAELPPKECMRLRDLEALQKAKQARGVQEDQLNFDRVVQAINLRCMQNQGVITVGRLGAFGPGWPSTFALALYDREELGIDFDGLFSQDRQMGTHHTEQAVMLLAEQCLAHSRNLARPRFPRLPGALVAAAIYAPPPLVHLLLDMGASLQEIDAFGETSFLKASRRGKMRGTALVLDTPQTYTHILTSPMESEDDTTRWRLKKFSLEMMRMWDQKQRPEGCIVPLWGENASGWRTGGGVLDELLYNFSVSGSVETGVAPWLRFRQAAAQHMCPLQRLRKLAEKVLQGSRESSLAKIPVGRVGLTLLCFRFFVCPEMARDMDGLDETPDSLRDALEQHALTLYDPTVFGQRSEQPEARTFLKRWAGFWALLNSVLTASGEREGDLVRDLHDIPGSAFASFLRLKKGSIYACPAPSLWRFAGKTGEGQPPQDGAPPFTRVRLRSCGRCHYEDVAKLQTTPGNSILMPALSTFVVDEVTFDPKTCSLAVRLISRGSLLASDPELRRWRDRVLEQAERAEVALGIGQDAEDAPRDIAARLRAQQALFRAQEEFEAEKHRQRAEMDARRRRRASEDAKHTFYSSHRNSMKPRSIVDRLASNIMKSISPCNMFSFTAIKAPARLPGRVWNNGDHGLHKCKGFPYMMRPACTLLHLMDRTPERVPDFGKQMLRKIELRRPFLDRTDFSHEIVVNAEAIDAYLGDCARRKETDEAFDEFVKDICVDGPTGPSAATLYGNGTFRITISELQQCVRSTQLHTGCNLPILFVLDFIRRFAMSSDCAWFVRATRAVPLSALADDERWQTQLRDIVEGLQGSAKLAEGRLADAKVKLEELKGQDDKEAFQRMRICNNQKIILGVAEQLEGLAQIDEVTAIRHELTLWKQQVIQNPQWWGFGSSRQVEFVFAKSLVELSTEMCISQKGYFITDGRNGEHNQMCAKAKNPVVFLSAPGIDFCFPLPTRLEASKYFLRDPEKAKELHLGWCAWRPGGEQSLRHRIKELYRTIFSSAQAQGVRNPSMLPLGLGVFLINLADHPYSKELAEKVKEQYFRAQFELLSEQDWGFENYFINAQQHIHIAKRILEDEIRDAGDYNMPTDGLYLRCNIVFHDRDAKFLAQELATLDMAPAFLNPSDSQAVIHGLLGMYWETGRGANYVGEEDWAATSTGSLASFSICRSAIGLDDVVLQLQDSQMLYVHKIFGAAGFLCTVCRSARHGLLPDQDSATYGPFTAVTYDLSLRHLTVFSLGAQSPPSSDGKQNSQEASMTFKLAVIARESLKQLMYRVEELAKCAANKRPPMGIAAFRKGAQAALAASRMMRPRSRLASASEPQIRRAMSVAIGDD
eukprot:TRINITY_DN6011_c0_g1_i1.p1 TRINITY_DN6011_c0_g1~~TRINITY_DN6011_c0_g1_i1.p1  ORF type:complete len:2888 (+),score=672.46 TRINITY_DN6011_c0_g1_i1:991-8664(+)